MQALALIICLNLSGFGAGILRRKRRNALATFTDVARCVCCFPATITRRRGRSDSVSVSLPRHYAVVEFNRRGRSSLARPAGRTKLRLVPVGVLPAI
jgi:hypothetical protein